MNLKKTFLTLSLFIWTQLHCAQRTPQPQNPASLQGLPTDLKKYLLPYIASGNIQEIENALLATATLDTKYHILVNNPSNLIAILNTVLDKAPYTAQVVNFVEKLQNKSASLPGMRSEEVVAWLNKVKARLVNGPELYDAINRVNSFHAQEAKNNILTLLQNKDIDMNWRNNPFKMTPLANAVERGSSEIIQALLKVGANPDLPDRKNWTPVMQAAWDRIYTDTIEILLKGGANPHLRDDTGKNALMIATAQNNEKAVSLLLAAKVDVNAQDDSGMTALMHSARVPSPEIIEMLFDAGANPELKNKNGRTALQIERDRYGSYSPKAYLIEQEIKKRKREQREL